VPSDPPGKAASVRQPVGHTFAKTNQGDQ